MQATPGAEREGVSVFYKDPAGRVFHTYSAYARGIDMLDVAYHYLDLVPKGRDEEGHEFPQFWVRRHDEYGKPLKTIKTDPVPTSWYRINSGSS